MTPRAWCPNCNRDLRLAEVVGEVCPSCGARLEHVRVDQETYREITRSVGTSPPPMIERLLDAFRAAMLEKFHARHEKAIARWGVSVVDPNYPWSQLRPEDIEAHMLEEIREWTEDSGPNRVVEDVDVANMAFLDWVSRVNAAVDLEGLAKKLAKGTRR
jgi:DNA-binding Lrp family transcriptional regulator